jgi:hypothetical protein
MEPNLEGLRLVVVVYRLPHLPHHLVLVLHHQLNKENEFTFPFLF